MNTDAELAPPSVTGPVDPLSRLVDRLVGGLALSCELLVAAMAVFISLDALLRWSIDWSFLVIDELGAYALLLLAFFGMVVALQQKALFRVEAIFDRLSDATRARLQLVYDVACLGFSTLLAWQLFALALRSFAQDITAPTILRTPLWMPQAAMGLGAALLALVLVAQIVQGVRRWRQGRYDPSDRSPDPS
jgi:TRAP-type C4-dicarboxylate transport system permease small subunit